MRYELTDFEWAAIKQMLPSTPRGVPLARSPHWSWPPRRRHAAGLRPVNICYRR